MFVFGRSWTRLSDKELLLQYARKGNSSAFDELFFRYHHLVYYNCRKYLKDDEESRDTTLEVFAKLATKLKASEIIDLPKWLAAVSRNHCLNKLRKPKGEPIRLSEFNEDQHSEHQTLEQKDFDERQNGRLLNELSVALEQLKIEQRRCLQLFYLEKKTYREISEKTGYEIAQVKSFLQNGKRNLQKMLTKESGKKCPD